MVAELEGNADKQVLAKQEELIDNSFRYTKELLAKMEQQWESQPGWDDGSSTGSSSDTSRPPQKTGLAPAAGKADIESGLPSDDSRNANVKDDDQEKKHNPNAGRKTCMRFCQLSFWASWCDQGIGQAALMIRRSRR